MFGSRFLQTALLFLLSAALPACSDGGAGAAERSDATATAAAGTGKAEKPALRGPKRVSPKAALDPDEIPPPNIAKSWIWEEEVSPELVLPLDWSFEEGLDQADWDGDVVVRIDGEEITQDELEGWLYLTYGGAALEEYCDVLAARDFRERVGLEPVAPMEDYAVADEVLLELCEPFLPGPELLDEYLTAKFHKADAGRWHHRNRIESFRTVYENLPEGDLPPEYIALFTDPRAPAGYQDLLEQLLRGEDSQRLFQSLNNAIEGFMGRERGLHRYTVYDHDDGLGGVVTLVVGHEIRPTDSFKPPWTLGGELRPVPVSELREAIPIQWTLPYKRAGLRSLAAYKLKRAALESSDQFADDESRWQNYWSGITDEVVPGMTHELKLSFDWRTLNFFESRMLKELQDYEKYQKREEEIMDPERMEAFLEKNRWNLDEWQFSGALIAVPFADPVTGLSKGPEAEQAAFEKLKEYQRRVIREKDFEFVAYAAAQALPDLPEVSNPFYAAWYEGLRNLNGRFSVRSRSDLQNVFNETTTSIWNRGTSLAEHFVLLKPGQVSKPWKGTTAWYLVRMYRGKPLRPPKDMADLGYRPQAFYLDYAYNRWGGEVLRSAEIAAP